MQQEETVFRTYDFELTQAEFVEKGKEAGNLAREIRTDELDFDDAKKEFKSMIESKEAKRDNLLYTINRGKEERRVPCKLVKDFSEGKIQYFFEGKLMEERIMTKEERQMEMPIV